MPGMPHSTGVAPQRSMFCVVLLHTDLGVAAHRSWCAEALGVAGGAGWGHSVCGTPMHMFRFAPTCCVCGCCVCVIRCPSAPNAMCMCVYWLPYLILVLLLLLPYIPLSARVQCGTVGGPPLANCPAAHNHRGAWQACAIWCCCLNCDRTAVRPLRSSHCQSAPSHAVFAVQPLALEHCRARARLSMSCFGTGGARSCPSMMPSWGCIR